MQVLVPNPEIEKANALATPLRNEMLEAVAKSVPIDAKLSSAVWPGLETAAAW
jgi:hypothetical protein